MTVVEGFNPFGSSVYIPTSSPRGDTSVYIPPAPKTDPGARQVVEGFNPFGPAFIPAPALPKGDPGARQVVNGFNPFEGQAYIPVMQPVVDPNNPYTQLPFYAGLKQCRACSARSEALQVVGGSGPVDARMLVLGQNPGDEEDRAGVPFIGQSGQEFDSWLPLLGLDRTKLMVTNVVHCHTTKNRVPRAKEIRTCSDLWLAEELKVLTAVEVIFTLGKPAVSAVLTKSAPPMTPLMVHHYRVKVFGRELHVFPLPHPAFFLRTRHLVPMFRETILHQLKLTLQQEVPAAYAWSQR